MSKLHYAKLALAVAAAISAGITYAQEDVSKKDSSYNITTKKIVSNEDPSLKLMEFSKKTIDTMNTETSKEFMRNETVLNVSTFPMKLLQKVSKTNWKPNPSRPIAKRDMACYFEVPSYREPKSYDVNTTPINIEADDVEGKIVGKDEMLVYKGNVIVTQGDKQIISDKAEYSSISKSIKTIGSTLLSAPEYTVTTTDGADYNMEKKTVKFSNSKYVMNGSVYNGTADEFESNDADGTKILKVATLSACPISKQSWHIYSSSIEIDRDSSFGSSWNDVLFLGKVPVFYTPYANFPITNKRRSGLLPIEIGYTSGKGLSYELPIYLNLATNYDATVTPSHDAKRGDYYTLELRDMPFKNLNGLIEGTVYTNDKKYNQTREEEGKSAVKRFLLKIEQNLSLLENDLNVRLDYSKVRNDDYTYLSDISQEDVAITDSSLVQSLSGNYIQDKFDIRAEIRRYQNMFSVYSVSSYKPFALEPQVSLSGYDSYGPFSFRLDSEVTKFTLDKVRDDRSNKLQFLRTHAEPSVQYHIYDGYGTTLQIGGRYFITHYDQSDLSELPERYQTRLGYLNHEDSITRSLYHIEAKAKTTLERKILDMRHTQTLEPELKYNYIPYKNQDNIALFDTTSRYDDYYTLFSYRKYAGLDRIANVNAVTAGFTTRILDPHDKEKFRFSIAQAFNFEDNKVKLYQTQNLRNEPHTPIEASMDAQPVEQIRFHIASQYDPDKDVLRNFNTTINFKNQDNLTLGTSYRYYRLGNYHVSKLTPVDVRQIGFDMSVPLSHDYKIFGAVYRDLEQKYNIDKKIGIKYEDCCFAISLLYESYMAMDWKNLVHNQDKFFGIQFEFKGLYTIKAKGISDPNGTGTHYLPSLDLTNLNQ